MNLDIEINDQILNLELINKVDNKYFITVDGKNYEVDLEEVEPGVFSVIYKNKSYNIEITPNKTPKSYTVSSLYHSFDTAILDAEAKYKRNRKKDDLDDEDIISSPMPGKVVNILVQEGDQVEAGETVIIISAMKMESEYKVKTAKTIKKINVKEGDAIDGNQPLIILES